MSKKIVPNIAKSTYLFSHTFGKIDLKSDFLDLKMDAHSAKVGDRFLFLRLHG